MADTKISAMTAAAALDGTEIVPIVQGGANVRTTTQDIADLSNAGAPADANYITGASNGTLSAETVIPALAEHPDAAPTSPNVFDDEFPGSSLDAKWTWQNQGSGTATVSKSTLVLKTPADAGQNMRSLLQSVSGNWTITAKCVMYQHSGIAGNARIGIVVRESSTGKLMSVELGYDGAMFLNGARWTNDTTFGAGVVTTIRPFPGVVCVYLRVAYDGTNYTLSWSPDGITFLSLGTVAKTTPFTTAGDQVGLFANSSASNKDTYLSCDWIRKT